MRESVVSTANPRAVLPRRGKAYNMNRSRFTRLLLLVPLMLALSAASFAGVFISITVAPPPLPVYVQPVCPEPGYLWTPGYWAWGDDGYYWVPGTWVPAPEIGMLWTPGYWGWVDEYYTWNTGYWGPQVGFYGGVNYGFGFYGEGFRGGEWRGRDFYYNSAVVNVDRTSIRNVYENRTVIVNNNNNYVSYNGGAGGIQRTPTRPEQAAARERHIQPTPQQTRQESAARQNPQLLARNNGGKPAIAATARPGDFSRKSAVAARAAGGRVDATSLQATPKSMPAAGRGPASSRPASGAATPSTPGNRNVTGTPGANRATPASPGGRVSSPGGNRPPPYTAPARTAPRTPAYNPSQNQQPRVQSQPAPAAPRTPAYSQPRPQQPRVQSRPAPAAQRPPAYSQPRPQQPRVQSRPAPAPRPSAAPRYNAPPARPPQKEKPIPKENR
jgi:WXXGXW repeat (2 copies)